MRVLVFGTFDTFHPGHMFFLQEAKKRGELHIVVARDANVERIKGRLPEQSEKERLSVIQTQCPFAHPTLGNESDFLTPLREINPDIILLGYDQKLPPGVSEDTIACFIERLPAFKPEHFKSSIRRKKML
jgi:FAD synthetase